MSKKLITNPITGKFIKKSGEKAINNIIQYFEGNYVSKKNLVNKVKPKLPNITDEEFFEKYYYKNK